MGLMQIWRRRTIWNKTSNWNNQSQ